MSRFQLFAKKPDGTEIEFDPLIDESAMDIKKIFFGDESVYDTLESLETVTEKHDADIEQLEDKLNAGINTLDNQKEEKTTAVHHEKGSSVGSAFKGIYVDQNGNAKTTIYSVETAVPTNAIFTDRYVNGISFESVGDGLKMVLTRSGSDKVSIEKSMKPATPTSFGPVKLGQSITTVLSSSDNTYTLNLNESNCFVGVLDSVSSETKTFIFNGENLGETSSFEFTIFLTKFGGSQVVWPSNIKWDSLSGKVLSQDGTDVLKFYTFDGGITWFGKLVISGAS